MPDAWLPGGLPHLPVCGVCLQPGRSHGPDPLRHHPDQVFFPPALAFILDSVRPERINILCSSLRTVSPELKSYALGVLFLLLRLLGKNFYQIHLYFIVLSLDDAALGKYWSRGGDVIGHYIIFRVLNTVCAWKHPPNMLHLRSIWFSSDCCFVTPHRSLSCKFLSQQCISIKKKSQLN